MVRVGVLAPTYNRPDLARFLALQLQNQSRKPDIVCFHQNGTPESYAWAIQDLQLDFEIKWVHTPNIIPQDQWYSVPLGCLIDDGCTHFFWCDHDDIYLRDHLKNSIRLIDDGDGNGPYDFVVNLKCGQLKLTRPYTYWQCIDFTIHAPGGMSSSMCFNRRFAVELLSDIENNAARHQYKYTDQVIGWLTKNKFRSAINQSSPPSTIYVSHSECVSSGHSIRQAPGYVRPLVNDASFTHTALIKLIAHVGVVGDIKCSDVSSVLGEHASGRCIQGFLIDVDPFLKRGLSYRARLSTGEWTPWASPGTFVGTRGLNRNLTGFSVKLPDFLKDNVGIRACGYFGSENQLVFDHEGDCTCPDTLKPLVGMQLLLTKP